jgi:hypothetical protein
MTFQIVGEIAQSVTRANQADTTTVIPAGYMIFAASMVESNTRTVTGGVKVGTTSGAADVVAAQAVGSNATVGLADAAILKKMFSATVDQTLFIQPVTSWNLAIVDVKFYLVRAIL